MHTTGIVRNVDHLGRIVLPMEIRRMMNINAHEPVEIFTEGNNILIRKYRAGCIFCGSEKHVSIFRGAYICESCIHELSVQNADQP